MISMTGCMPTSIASAPMTATLSFVTADIFCSSREVYSGLPTVKATWNAFHSFLSLHDGKISHELIAYKGTIFASHSVVSILFQNYHHAPQNQEVEGEADSTEN